MKILMLSSEALPFAKSGGLGDAVSSLSAALSRAGHDLCIVLPRYYSIDRSKLEQMPGVLCVPSSTGEDYAAVYRDKLPGSKAWVYFIDYEKYFGRDGIYGNRQEPDFADNPERFSFLCRAAFSLCLFLDWIPDIMHGHDWAAALMPVYLRHRDGRGRFAKTASVFSIHNLGYQGVYPKEHFPALDLPWDLFHGAGFEYYDKINLLKAGISSADVLATVSPSYAREIQTPQHGFGLDGLLRARGRDLVGILNGIDPADWDPSRDKYLPAHFSRGEMAGKRECKAALQRRLGLPLDEDKPLFGMVARLTDQKGIGELFGPTYGSAYNICADMELQMAVIGSGEVWCERELSALSLKLPNFRAMIGYDEALAHLVEAGSDFFLMPSRYEPCGLNQMYSLRYGTLPVAHRTGGLADTIENYDQDSGGGTGFLFDRLTPRSVYDTVGWAVWAWYNRRTHIKAMQKRAMSRDFSWDRSVREYLKLYEGALVSCPGKLLSV